MWPRISSVRYRAASMATVIRLRSRLLRSGCSQTSPNSTSSRSCPSLGMNSYTVGFLGGMCRSPRVRGLFLRAASVGLLERADRLIVERDRRAPMALFADEVEAGRRLMTAQARLALGEVDHTVAAVADLCAGRRDLQGEKFPSVGFGELLTWILHHGFERNQLEDRADRIVLVRDAVAEDAHRLGELLGIRVLDARVPDLGPVQDAPEGLLGYGHVSGRRDQPAGKPGTRAKRDSEEHQGQAGLHSELSALHRFPYSVNT